MRHALGAERNDRRFSEQAPYTMPFVFSAES